MNATELFRAGKLSEAIEAQLKEVKAKPADHGRRVFLFELLAFSGDLERAGRQLDNVQYGQPELDTAVAGYRQLLGAETARRRLFSDGLVPVFFSPPPEHVLLRVEAVNQLRNNEPADAAELLAKANEAAPAIQGMLNDKPFTALRDADDLLAHVLEVMAHGKYYWVPFEQIQSLTANPPSAPRDLLWFPAKLELVDGAAGDVFLPSLYPLSYESTDEQVKLGRLTDWKTPENGPVLGIGLHMLVADENDVTLLEVRQMQRATT